MSFEKLTELKVLKSKTRISSKDKNNLETQGLTIEILKQIPYFRGEAETYGIQVLSYYIPIIQPYMLRAGMQIIDTNEEYVVMEGLVRGIKNDGKLGNLYPEGVLIDPSFQLNKPQPERQSLSSTTECDTKLIKIFRNTQDNKLMKQSQALAKFQKERLTKQRQMQRAFIVDKSLHDWKQKLNKFQFFQNLTSYDLDDLVIQSKFMYFKKCSTLHEFGSSAERVGFLLTGQVRIDNSVIHNKQKIVEAGQLLLEKYMVHKKEHNSSVITIAEAGQWIGLEEYLWNQRSFLSRAEVVSHDAEILYVPFDVFSKKFNELTAYYLMNKLKGLTETKKKLLNKNIQTKKQKEDQILEQKMKIETLEKMQERLEKNIKSIDSVSNKKKTSANSKTSPEKFLKPRGHHRHFPSQCYMPERLVHKIKNFEQKYESLPKIQQRVVLFPQQYEKAMVPLELREELKMAKQARNPFRKNMNARPFKILSNEKVYETVIYASLSPKQSSNPEQDKKKMLSKLKSAGSIDNSQDTETKMDMLQTIGSIGSTSRQRFNFSIFNNFRAPKNKGQKLLENISKTLQII